MLPKNDKKKKDAGKLAKSKEPVNQSGGKTKEKWSKGKVWVKFNNLVLLDQAPQGKLYKEVPNYKCITPVEKIPGSLARVALQEEVCSKGLIQLVSKYRAQVISTRNKKGRAAPAAGEDV